MEIKNKQLKLAANQCTNIEMVIKMMKSMMKDIMVGEF